MKRRNKFLEAIWGPFDESDPLEWLLLMMGVALLVILFAGGIS